MDKIKINNQVISMRKFVKQAKVRSINKIVKEVKLLQIKKGTEMQVEKYKRKSERLLSEIEIIKKINFDTVSKMALLNEKDWKAVLSSKTAALEERAFAMLANYEPIQAEVKLFRAKNPRYVKLLPDFIQLWEEKRQQNSDNKSLPKSLKASEIRKNKKEKRLKLKSKTGLKNQPTRKEAGNVSIQKNAKPNHNETEAPNEVSANNLSFSDSQTEAPKDEMDVFSDVRENVDGLEKKFVSTKNAVSEHESSNLKTETSGPLFISDVKECSVLSKKASKEIAVLNLEELAGQEIIPIKGASDNEDDKNLPQVTKTDGENRRKDPFFLGGEENSENNDESSDDLESDAALNSNSVGRSNEKDVKKNFRGKNNNYDKYNIYSEKKMNFNRKTSFKANNSQFRQGPVRTEKFQDQSYGGIKKNFNPQKRNFPETRTKFPRNSNNIQTDSRSSQKSFPGGKNKNQHFVERKLSNTGSSLHPSWEAKRKMSAKTMNILPYQGKKVKFDD